VKQRGLAAALALAALLLLPTLALRGIWPPDETRYADVARGMLASGDFVVPRLHGSVYGEKPPVFFWATAAATALGVPLSVAPRLVSVLSALATLALLPLVGAGLGFGPRDAARGALVLATTPLFLLYAQMGLLDLLCTFLVTAAIAARCAREGAGAGRRLALAGTEGLALGLALLTKGPVLLLFPLGLCLGAWLSRTPRRPARPERSDALVLALALGVAGAWLAAAWQGAGGPEYVRSITIGQAVRRVSGEAPHLRAPGFLLATSLLGFLPWTLLVAGALPRLWRQPPGRWPPGAAPLLGWVGLPLGLLSLLETQQPHYVLPALPAAALAAGALLREEPPAWVRRGLQLLGVGLGLATLAAAFALPQLLRALHLDPAARALLEEDPALRGLALAMAVALVVLASVRRLGPADTVPRRAALGAACLVAGLLALSWRVDPLMLPRELLARPELRTAPRLVAPMSLRSAVRVQTGRTEVDLLAERELLEQMRREPGLVALLWWRDLVRLDAPSGTFQQIGRGFARGRSVVAVRLARGSGGPGGG
jgi:4-amino-4-deoxy-L-arabinose transferase-like glycosyltransferase